MVRLAGEGPDRRRGLGVAPRLVRLAFGEELWP